MKRILISAITALSMALLPAAVASAQISNTGPGSTNIISDTSTITCTSTSSNNVEVTNNTNQSSGSGSASVSENTTGGGATSGSSSNSSASTTSLLLTNSNPCVASATTTPTTPPPSVGGEVLGEATLASTSPVVVASLPETAGTLGSANVAAATSAVVSGAVLLVYAIRAWINRERV